MWEDVRFVLRAFEFVPNSYLRYNLQRLVREGRGSRLTSHTSSLNERSRSGLPNSYPSCAMSAWISPRETSKWAGESTLRRCRSPTSPEPKKKRR